MSCQWNVVAEEPIQSMVICAQKLQECLEQQPVLSLKFCFRFSAGLPRVTGYLHAAFDACNQL